MITIDENSSLVIKKEESLFSNLYNKMLTIIEDTVGKHDLLFPACSFAMYRTQYNISNYHPSCLENLAKAVERYKIYQKDIPNPFNIFMNTNISPDGRISVGEPLSQAGDFIELRAEMDLFVAISACSVAESKCNGYRCTSVKVQIYNSLSAAGDRPDTP